MIFLIAPAHAQKISGNFPGGSVQVGADTSTCNYDRAGAIRLSSNVMQFCDGSCWKPMSDEGQVTNGLVANWAMDDNSGATVKDYYGANNGTALGNPVWASGRINGGLTFDGADDIVNIPASATFANDSYTIALWYRPASTSGAGTLFEHARGQPNWYGAFSNHQQVHFRVTPDHTMETWQAPLSVGVWSHIVMTYDASNTQNAVIYVNGVALYSTSTTPGTPGAGAITIGSNSVNEYANGIIDDIRIYNRALSPAEVAKLYNMCP